MKVSASFYSRWYCFSKHIIAHEIRNRLTKQFEAVHGLTAQHRWCLTGTPIQNSLEDLGALISFLRIPILEKVTTFRRYIIQPTTSNLGNRYRNLQTLLQSVCLRRTRENLGLPETFPREKLIPFSDRERNEYDELYRHFGNRVQMAVSGHTSKLSATALHSIHELRLFCNNGLKKPGGEGVETDDELLSGLLQREMNTCANCSGVIFSIEGGNSSGGTFISTCKHLVCNSCLPQCYKGRGGCVLCLKNHKPTRAAYDTILSLSRPGENGDSLERRPEEYPSKLLALVKDLGTNTWNKWQVVQWDSWAYG